MTRPSDEVTVEAFRGFRDRQEFNLDASAVVIAGPNGTGKTSFFDALQWCLLGSIQRLEGFRARRNVEHIVNQYRLNNRAVVEVQLVVRGRAFTVRRTGDHRGSTLEFGEQEGESVFGEEANTLLAEALVPGGELTLEMALMTSGLMQQDVMRAVLEAKPADRYRHISTVLGLGALEDFEGAAKELAAEAKSRTDAARDERDSMAASLSEARARLAEAEQRLQTLPQVEALRAETLAVLQEAPPFVRIDSAFELQTSDSAREVAAMIGELIDRLQSFVAAWADAEDARGTLRPEPTSEELAAAAAARDGAREQLAAAQERRASVETRLASAQAASEETARLAALAIPMLTDRCPVCGQTIDAANVEQELRARAADTGIMLTLQGDLRQARIDIHDVEVAANQAENQVRALDDRRRRWNAYRRNQQAAEALFSAVVSPATPLAVTAASAEALADAAAPALEFLRMARRRVLEFLNALEQGLDRGAVERAESEVASFGDAVELRARRLEEESQRAQQLSH